jgi:uncharacterized protein DUF5134
VSPSPISALAFTAAFAVPALSSSIRLVGPATGSRMVPLSHLLMSVAMAGMAWGWPASGGIGQFTMIGLLAALFLVRVLRPAGNGRAGSSQHLLVLVAMGWMLAAMPGGMAAHPAWMQVVTLAFLVLLGNAALASVVEEHRASPVPVPAGGQPMASRLDAAGQVLMTGGMAGMLLTML